MDKKKLKNLEELQNKLKKQQEDLEDKELKRIKNMEERKKEEQLHPHAHRSLEVKLWSVFASSVNYNISQITLCQCGNTNVHR